MLKPRKKPLNKRCKDGYPCKKACISRKKECLGDEMGKFKYGQAKTFLLWEKAQQERLALTNKKRERAGLTPARLSDSKYITAERTKLATPQKAETAIAVPESSVAVSQPEKTAPKNLPDPKSAIASSQAEVRPDLDPREELKRLTQLTAKLARERDLKSGGMSEEYYSALREFQRVRGIVDALDEERSETRRNSPEFKKAQEDAEQERVREWNRLYGPMNTTTTYDRIIKRIGREPSTLTDNRGGYWGDLTSPSVNAIPKQISTPTEFAKSAIARLKSGQILLNPKEGYRIGSSGDGMYDLSDPNLSERDGGMRKKLTEAEAIAFLNTKSPIPVVSKPQALSDNEKAIADSQSDATPQYESFLADILKQADHKTEAKALSLGLFSRDGNTEYSFPENFVVDGKNYNISLGFTKKGVWVSGNGLNQKVSSGDFDHIGALQALRTIYTHLYKTNPPRLNKALLEKAMKQKTETAANQKRIDDAIASPPMLTGSKDKVKLANFIREATIAKLSEEYSYSVTSGIPKDQRETSRTDLVKRLTDVAYRQTTSDFWLDNRKVVSGKRENVVDPHVLKEIGDIESLVGTDTNPTIKTKKATAYEIGKFKEITQEAYKKGDTTNGNMWRGLSKSVRGQSTIVAKDGTQIKGAALIDNTVYSDGLRVSLVATHPNYKGQGIGRSLMVEAAKMAKSKGVGFTVSAIAESEPFFQKIGMENKGNGLYSVKKEDVDSFIKKNYQSVIAKPSLTEKQKTETAANQKKIDDAIAPLAELAKLRTNDTPEQKAVEVKFEQQNAMIGRGAKTYDEIKALAEKTPYDYLNEFSPKRAEEFKQYAERSGQFWKDTRTGHSFKLSEAEKKDLRSLDIARSVLGLPERLTPDGKPKPVTPKPIETPVEGTPRAIAAKETEAQKSDYEFARKSAVPNAGEDLLGSARHIRNQWRSLAEAEQNGSAQELVTRKNLLKNEPLKLMETIDNAHALSHLAAYLSMNAFPPIPFKKEDYDRSSLAQRSGTEAQLREQYYNAFKKIKGIAEDQARLTTDPYAVTKAIFDATGKEINRLRAETNNYNPVANALVSLHKATQPRSLARYYRDREIGGKLYDFSQRIEKAYGNDGLRNLEQVKEHASRIIEGKSFNESFDTIASKEGQFNAADAYVNVATRTGGRVIDAKTVETGTKFLIENVGFRGVQYGNSVTDNERVHHLQKSSEALADLADMTGLPDSAISLNGTLGLAIGARGKGNALAHYEPGNKVINLTRKSGIGSLAHEWAHALDNYISGGTSFTSKDYWRSKDDPIARAMKAVDTAMDDSGFSSRLNTATREKKMSAAKTNYWRSPEEKFARTFERFIQDKLIESGRENTYLAGLSKTIDPLWPNREEIKAIAPAIEKLLTAIREKHFE